MHFEDARTPIKCIESLGLSAQPEIHKYVSDNGGGLTDDLAHTAAADVVYRADHTSLMQGIPAFSKPPPPDIDPVEADDNGVDFNRFIGY